MRAVEIHDLVCSFTAKGLERVVVPRDVDPKVVQAAERHCMPSGEACLLPDPIPEAVGIVSLPALHFLVFRIRTSSRGRHARGATLFGHGLIGGPAAYAALNEDPARLLHPRTVGAFFEDDADLIEAGARQRPARELALDAVAAPVGGEWFREEIGGGLGSPDVDAEAILAGLLGGETLVLCGVDRTRWPLAIRSLLPPVMRRAVGASTGLLAQGQSGLHLVASPSPDLAQRFARDEHRIIQSGQSIESARSPLAQRLVAMAREGDDDGLRRLAEESAVLAPGLRDTQAQQAMLREFDRQHALRADVAIDALAAIVREAVLDLRDLASRGAGDTSRDDVQRELADRYVRRIGRHFIATPGPPSDGSSELELLVMHAELVVRAGADPTQLEGPVASRARSLWASEPLTAVALLQSVGSIHESLQAVVGDILLGLIVGNQRDLPPVDERWTVEVASGLLAWAGLGVDDTATAVELTSEFLRIAPDAERESRLLVVALQSIAPRLPPDARSDLTIELLQAASGVLPDAWQVACERVFDLLPNVREPDSAAGVLRLRRAVTLWITADLPADRAIAVLRPRLAEVGMEARLLEILWGAADGTEWLDRWIGEFAKLVVRDRKQEFSDEVAVALCRHAMSNSKIDELALFSVLRQQLSQKEISNWLESLIVRLSTAERWQLLQWARNLPPSQRLERRLGEFSATHLRLIAEQHDSSDADTHAGVLLEWLSELNPELPRRLLERAELRWKRLIANWFVRNAQPGVPKPLQGWKGAETVSGLRELAPALDSWSQLDLFELIPKRADIADIASLARALIQQVPIADDFVANVLSRFANLRERSAADGLALEIFDTPPTHEHTAQLADWLYSALVDSRIGEDALDIARIERIAAFTTPWRIFRDHASSVAMLSLDVWATLLRGTLPRIDQCVSDEAAEHLLFGLQAHLVRPAEFFGSLRDAERVTWRETVGRVLIDAKSETAKELLAELLRLDDEHAPEIAALVLAKLGPSLEIPDEVKLGSTLARALGSAHEQTFLARVVDMLEHRCGGSPAFQRIQSLVLSQDDLKGRIERAIERGGGADVSEITVVLRNGPLEGFDSAIPGMLMELAWLTPRDARKERPSNDERWRALPERQVLIGGAVEALLTLDSSIDPPFGRIRAPLRWSVADTHAVVEVLQPDDQPVDADRCIRIGGMSGPIPLRRAAVLSAGRPNSIMAVESESILLDLVELALWVLDFDTGAIPLDDLSNSRQLVSSAAGWALTKEWFSAVERALTAAERLTEFERRKRRNVDGLDRIALDGVARTRTQEKWPDFGTSLADCLWALLTTDRTEYRERSAVQRLRRRLVAIGRTDEGRGEEARGAIGVLVGRLNQYLVTDPAVVEAGAMAESE